MTADDVYTLILSRSSYTQNLVIAVIVLVSLLFLFAAPASVMFLFDARGRRKQYAQNKRILDMAEKHGELTDAKYKEKARMIADEVRHILELKQLVAEGKEQVAEVKEKVGEVKEKVSAIDDRLPEFPSGGRTVSPAPVDPNNPPKRRAEDRKP